MFESGWRISGLDFPGRKKKRRLVDHRTQIGVFGAGTGGTREHVPSQNSVIAMLSAVLEASRRRRQRRTWKHGAIKYAALVAIMVFLCLLYVKQSPASFEHTDSSDSGFTQMSTFRSTLDDDNGPNGGDGDDGGGCDRYAKKRVKRAVKVASSGRQFHRVFLALSN